MGALRDMLNTLVGEARGTFDRLQVIPTEVGERLERLKVQNEAFALAPASHHQDVVARWTKEYRAVRLKACGVAIFNLDHSLPGIGQQVAEVKALSRRAPDPLTTYAMRTGKRPGEKLEQYLELEVLQLDEARRARFHRELTNLPPSTIADLYEECRYAIDVDDEAASLVRWIEQRFSAGWIGPAVKGTAEVEAARRLQRSIRESQDARVPCWIADIESEIADASKLVTRVTTAGVRPLNPQMDNIAAKAFEAEMKIINDDADKPRSKHLDVADDEHVA